MYTCIDTGDVSAAHKDVTVDHKNGLQGVNEKSSPVEAVVETGSLLFRPRSATRVMVYRVPGVRPVRV